MIEHAVILAAGLGKRMRPLTKACPKPLIPVAGQAIIDHTYNALARFGVKQIVVNCHYLPDQIHSWADAKPADGPAITISDESDKLLDSGGGVKQALSLLPKSKALFVANGDSFWIEGASSSLARMVQIWDAGEMDCLLLLANAATATGYSGLGDFTLTPDGRLERRLENQIAPFVFAGCYLTTPAYFAKAPKGAFSVNELWNRSLKKGRLFGIRHDGPWLHIGTPEAISEAERAIEDG